MCKTELVSIGNTFYENTRVGSDVTDSPLNHEINPNCVYKFSSYLKSLRCCYKDQSLNGNKGNNRCLFSKLYKTHKRTPLCRIAEFFNVKTGGSYNNHFEI
jgi:hypothetical protein